jgi:anti-sigma regulatory factor (Ser/Thr protein kinase)
MSRDPGGGTVQASLVARNSVSELARLSEFLAAFFAQNALPPDVIGDFELALEEVFVNVVRYGHPQGGEHEIAIGIALEGGEVTLTMEDDGVAFNPLEARLVDLDLPLEERGIGGLGLHLVKGLMDEVAYERANDRNRFMMRKKVRA